MKDISYSQQLISEDNMLVFENLESQKESITQMAMNLAVHHKLSFAESMYRAIQWHNEKELFFDMYAQSFERLASELEG